jgi:2-dehydro-3-deoxyglucarate aldolase/4-hydroxy-2-oxoheptanedioate aldolase
MVTSKKEIDELINFTLYPPEGNRGFGPMAAIRYGLDDAAEYVKSSNKDICRFIQIEHKDVIDNLDEIMENEHIDGYIFGPNDLSGSIGEMLNVYGENTTNLMKVAIQKLKSKDKYIGVATGSTKREVISHWHSMGINMITAGADYVYLMEGAEKMRKIFDEELKGNE